jgi:nucleotide-binding universal stress UspA family protein
MISILTTVDGSEESLAVIPAVEKLVGGQPAQVRLLMVVDRPSGTARRSSIARAPTGPAEGVPGAPEAFTPPLGSRPSEPRWAESEEQAFERAMEEGRDYLELAAKPLRDKGIQVEVDAIVGDHVSEAIVEAAREHKVDMIAMATHGRSGLSGVVQGSVAAAVVRSGVAPVLQVRPSKKG